ncbi:MAG: serine/threonine protein kinase [Myxococcales bacterium]|nr:serine/threonine protein kinase [Myxococcales bacterium]
MSSSLRAVAPTHLEITGEIGSGAIATVVRVVDADTGLAHAAKILHERHRRDEGALRRFQREAELACGLRHDNLVRVHGAVPLDGRPALLMELVEGPNLSDHLAQQGPLDEPELVELALGIARGLAHAHAAGVIHRDLKPANILLAPGPVPKIADFGMARASSFAGADKGALTVLGTPGYMAPECLEPLAVDPRTDLYALGCILYELATGAPPFGGATPFAVLDQHRNAPAPALPERFSPGLRRLVARLLAKAPGDRPQSARAVVEALESLRDSGGALVPVEPSALAAVDPELAADGRCAGCGAAVLKETRVCFRCGLVQVVIEPGPCSIFVTGPGKVSHKLDSERRDRLLRWLRANEAVGLDPGGLGRRIPRLPFVLLTGLSQRSVETLAASLQRIGIETAWARGGRLSHFGILRNTNKLAGRAMAICVGIVGTPMMIHPGLGLLSLPVLAAVLPFVYGTTLYRASRPVATTRQTDEHGLPPRVKARLDELPAVVAQIGERRHREALRAVVHRVITLSRNTPPAMQPEIEAEMEHALHLAAGATLRMDQLDREMTAAGFDPAEPSARALMHERDLWSARLLELTATLDALAARRAAARAMADDVELPEHLEHLRATVEALEEVQRG